MTSRSGSLDRHAGASSPESTMTQAATKEQPPPCPIEGPLPSSGGIGTDTATGITASANGGSRCAIRGATSYRVGCLRTEYCRQIHRPLLCPRNRIDEPPPASARRVRPATVVLQPPACHCKARQFLFEACADTVGAARSVRDSVYRGHTAVGYVHRVKLSSQPIVLFMQRKRPWISDVFDVAADVTECLHLPLHGRGIAPAAVRRQEDNRCPVDVAGEYGWWNSRLNGWSMRANTAASSGCTGPSSRFPEARQN